MFRLQDDTEYCCTTVCCFRYLMATWNVLLDTHRTTTLLREVKIKFKLIHCRGNFAWFADHFKPCQTHPNDILKLFFNISRETTHGRSQMPKLAAIAITLSPSLSLSFTQTYTLSPFLSFPLSAGSPALEIIRASATSTRLTAFRAVSGRWNWKAVCDGFDRHLRCSGHEILSTVKEEEGIKAHINIKRERDIKQRKWNLSLWGREKRKIIIFFARCYVCKQLLHFYSPWEETLRVCTEIDLN